MLTVSNRWPSRASRLSAVRMRRHFSYVAVRYWVLFLVANEVVMQSRTLGTWWAYLISYFFFGRAAVATWHAVKWDNAVNERDSYGYRG